MATQNMAEEPMELESTEGGWIDVSEWQLRIIQLLSVPGMVLAYYLWLFHDSKVFPSCTISELWDCGQVSGPSGQFSSLGGVPVALIGLLGYAAIFLLIWLKDWFPALDDNMPELMTIVTGMAFGFTLFLTGLEAFVIHAFCQYCIVSGGIVTIMFVLSLLFLRSSRKARRG